jgi:hypothetical protein
MRVCESWYFCLGRNGLRATTNYNYPNLSCNLCANFWAVGFSGIECARNQPIGRPNRKGILQCRKRKQSSGCEKPNGQVNRQRPKRESSCERKCTISAKESTVPAQPSKPLQSACRRPVARESNFRHRKKVKPPRKPARAPSRRIRKAKVRPRRDGPLLNDPGQFIARLSVREPLALQPKRCPDTPKRPRGAALLPSDQRLQRRRFARRGTLGCRGRPRKQRELAPVAHDVTITRLDDTAKQSRIPTNAIRQKHSGP